MRRRWWVLLTLLLFPWIPLSCHPSNQWLGTTDGHVDWGPGAQWFLAADPFLSLPFPFRWYFLLLLFGTPFLQAFYIRTGWQLVAHALPWFLGFEALCAYGFFFLSNGHCPSWSAFMLSYWACLQALFVLCYALGKRE